MSEKEHYKNLSLDNLICEINGIVYHEKWANIDGYNDAYKVSNFGRIKTVPRVINRGNGTTITKEQIIKPFLCKGYLRVTLCINNKKTKVSPHILCAENFLCKKPSPFVEVNHKDGVKSNAHISNLEWVTKSENLLHSFQVLGRKPTKFWSGKTGYNNHSSKEVLCVTNKKLYGSTQEAAEKLNVDRRMVSAVCLGKRNHTGGFVFKYVV